jgi:hypothetical protein
MNPSFCPHCGKPHPNQTAFCPQTGQPIQHVAAMPAPPAQQAYAPPHAEQAYAPHAQQAYAPNAPHAYQPHAQAYAPPGQQAYAPYPPGPGAQAPYGSPVQAPLYATAAPRAPGVRHSYPLAIREAGFGTAVGLMMRTLPYALVRFGVLLCVSIATLMWFVIAFGGWGLLGSKIHPGVGFGWFLFSCAIYGYLWTIIVRYFLYLLKCGHIAVLTELITTGQIATATKECLPTASAS